jgi:hypothetical protein
LAVEEEEEEEVWLLLPLPPGWLEALLLSFSLPLAFV